MFVCLFVCLFYLNYSQVNEVRKIRSHVRVPCQKTAHHVNGPEGTVRMEKSCPIFVLLLGSGLGITYIGFLTCFSTLMQEMERVCLGANFITSLEHNTS